MLKEKQYFEELSDTTTQTIRDLMQLSIDSHIPNMYSERFEPIECRSRSGFIASSYNCGGFVWRGFTDLMGLWGGGYMPSHAGAAKEIERQIDYNMQLVSEQVYEEFKSLFDEHKLTIDDCNYHRTEELGEPFTQVCQRIQELECDYLGDEQASIMYELRVMYHGMEGSKHIASVSAAVNTEGPYHRSSISWAPNVFCEGSKEVEISWSNDAELADKLERALAKVTKAIF